MHTQCCFKLKLALLCLSLMTSHAARLWKKRHMWNKYIQIVEISQGQMEITWVPNTALPRAGAFPDVTSQVTEVSRRKRSRDTGHVCCWALCRNNLTWDRQLKLHQGSIWKNPVNSKDMQGWRRGEQEAFLPHNHPPLPRLPQSWHCDSTRMPSCRSNPRTPQWKWL